MRSFISFTVFTSIVGMLSASTVSAGPVPKQCNEACSQEYNPICGVDDDGNSMIFRNPCTFDLYKCQHPSLLFDKAEMTKCGEPNKAEECPTMCSTVYNPVCGVDGNGNFRVFGNPCEFNVYNCQNPRKRFFKADRKECRPELSEH